VKSYKVEPISSGTAAARGSADNEISPLVRFGALSLFALNVLISIAAVRWQVGGIPVRSFFALAALGLLAVAAPSIMIDAVRRSSQVLLLILGFALLGAIVTRLAGDTWALAGRQLLEIHVQAALGFVLAVVIVRTCGLRPAAWIFISIVLLSAFVALLQYMHIDFAWQARAAIGRIEQDPPLTQFFYMRRERALGLSYSPVHIGTQACLAFAAFYALRLYDQTRRGSSGLDTQLFVALGVLFLACFVTGNRSPLLGAVAFLSIYLFAKAPKVFWLALPLVVAGIPIVLAVLDGLANKGVRIASTEDGSALGRQVLADFGWRLFLDRPIGYGLGFDSTQHYNEFSQYLLYFANPEQARLYPPHNYVLNMLNKYGVGMVLLIPLFLPRRRSTYYAALPFSAYLLHILFHNDGPFQADFLIWYVFAMFTPALSLMNQEGSGSQARSVGSWRYWAGRHRGVVPAASRQP
jgi:hypothetical protein